MILIIFPTWSHSTVQRSIVPNSQCGQFTITLTIQPEQNVESYAFIEKIPWPAKPSYISHEGFWDERHRIIRWGTFLDHDQRTITYTLSSEDGTFSLDGKISLTGKTESIAGLSEFTADCTPKPLPKPTFNPISGTQVPVTVSIECSVTDAEIYYSLDSFDPEKGQANTFLYSHPLALTENTYIKARAYKTGMLPGKIAFARYPKPALPLGNIEQRILYHTDCMATVTLSLTPVTSVESWAFAETLSYGLMPSQISHDGYWDQQFHTIRWGTFLDNSPRQLSYKLESKWMGQFYLDGLASFMGKRLSRQSEINFDCLPLLDQVAKPTVDPPDGTEVPVDVSIYCDTPDATIYYTFNGTEPDTSSLKYTGPIHINQACQLNIKAFKDALRESDTLTVFYYEKPLPQPLVLRSIERNETCHPTVELHITPQEHIEAWAIEEKLPVGIIPTRISDNGYWDAAHQTIRWGVMLDNNERTLSYQFESNKVIQSIALSGNVSFMGATYVIAGDIETHIDCTQEIVDAPILSPPDGSRAPVQIVMTCNTPEAHIYYTTDTSIPDENSILYTSPFDISEDTIIKAIAIKAGMTNSQIIQASYIRYIDKAIIVTGIEKDDWAWDAILQCAKSAYLALMYRGYKKIQLLFLSAEFDVDLDDNGDTEDDVSDLSTPDNLEQAIKSWAADAKDLFIYLVGHGEPDKFYMKDNQVVDASILDQWLDTAESQIQGHLFLFYEACYSGSFIDKMKNESIISDSKRIVITSTSNINSYMLPNGTMSFSYQFWSALTFISPYLYTAFTEAGYIMEDLQSPLLDADANGIQDKTDQDKTAYLMIGNEKHTPNVRPKILNKQKCVMLNGKTSHTFRTEKIISSHPIQNVWAKIFRPRHHSAGTGSQLSNRLDFDYSDQIGQYTANYSDFHESGIYKVNILAKDSQGIISLPSTVYIFSGDSSQWKGDINLDRTIDMEDIITALKIVSGMPYNSTCGAAVSCDEDDAIDLLDVLHIFNDIGGSKTLD
jgi:hypothetical protein